LEAACHTSGEQTCTGELELAGAQLASSLLGFDPGAVYA
jgi:hypothetical protein